MSTKNLVAVGVTNRAKELVKKFYSENFKSKYAAIEDEVDFDAVFAQITHQANTKDFSVRGLMSHQIFWNWSKGGETVSIELYSADMVWAVSCDSDR